MNADTYWNIYIYKWKYRDQDFIIIWYAYLWAWLYVKHYIRFHCLAWKWSVQYFQSLYAHFFKQKRWFSYSTINEYTCMHYLTLSTRCHWHYICTSTHACTHACSIVHTIVNYVHTYSMCRNRKCDLIFKLKTKQNKQNDRGNISTLFQSLPSDDFQNRVEILPLYFVLFCS